MRQSWLIVSAIVALFLGGCSGSDHEAKGALVLAASSMQEALDAAADAWAAKGNPRPVISFAATSAIARQIEAGAPGDLFVSADEKWMDEVAGKDLLKSGTRGPFLTNSIVLVAPADHPARIAIGPKFPLAEKLGQGRLAMADPDAVPAGRYGKQALVSLGVWDSVSYKIANAENVRAALALVSRNEAPLGIVYATDALAEPGVVVAGRFPEDSHQPIVYDIAQLAVSKNPQAGAFLNYLRSDEGKEILRRYGFGTA